MSDTVFTKVDYDLGTLVKYIGLGEIGLPDIQRPFVWKNAKVRDLFDSMYRGYPVGYLLLWRNGLADDRAIGTDAKQKPPRLVIVDGQQRLTSLYAVVKAVSVVRQNYESERISIAFNPLEERFEVTDAAIRRDKAFLADISAIWSNDGNLFKVANDYLSDLQSTREVTNEEISRIQSALTKLQGLLNFPFTALELAADISEEDVSDVFVRINSKGTPLNQADFILTLMSVFWDDGRAELERFCREARKPSSGRPSPYNHFIEPSPDQLLRVSVGLAFKRARLQYVYSILRGKDLETGKFSEERRIAQFEKLKDAQSRVLNLQYWHDFMLCIRQAGFRSHRMISSNNNLLFAYQLYLIGRTEYQVPEKRLRRLIARWYFMSSLTGRYTGSPESDMEFDLARFRSISDGTEFVTILNRVFDTTLTNDFWMLTLPSDLATSSSRSPSLFAFYASQVTLDARALFSNVRISELLDPAVQAPRSAVERHHLFPKKYLKTLGIAGRRETNQIANYSLVEWGDNAEILDSAPSDYLPIMAERINPADLARQYYWHALPEDWDRMPYQEFLKQRREKIAQVIRDGYEALSTEDDAPYASSDGFDLESIVSNGESAQVEFKSTLRINLHTGEKDS